MEERMGPEKVVGEARTPVDNILKKDMPKASHGSQESRSSHVLIACLGVILEVLRPGNQLALHAVLQIGRGRMSTDPAEFRSS